MAENAGAEPAARGEGGGGGLLGRLFRKSDGRGALRGAAWRLALAAAVAGADVVVLLNGDRSRGAWSAASRSASGSQTPYGVLVIPVDKVERIQRDDGSEEVLERRRPRPPPTPSPRRRPPRRRWCSS